MSALATSRKRARLVKRRPPPLQRECWIVKHPPSHPPSEADGFVLSTLASTPEIAKLQYAEGGSFGWNRLARLHGARVVRVLVIELPVAKRARAKGRRS